MGRNLAITGQTHGNQVFVRLFQAEHHANARPFFDRPAVLDHRIEAPLANRLGGGLVEYIDGCRLDNLNTVHGAIPRDRESEVHPARGVSALGSARILGRHIVCALELSDGD